jgi:hypothetical protein
MVGIKKKQILNGVCFFVQDQYQSAISTLIGEDRAMFFFKRNGTAFLLEIVINYYGILYSTE